MGTPPSRKARSGRVIGTGQVDTVARMMNRKVKNSGAQHRALMEPLAVSLGLDHDRESLDPGNSPAQLAYGFAECGGLLLLSSAYDEGFPTDDRRTTKRGVKALEKGLSGAGAQQASIMLAHALAAGIEESFLFEGEDAEARCHASFRALLQEHLPVPQRLLDVVEGARAEFRTFDTGVVREPIRMGAEGGTGYHIALQDPSFNDGQHPDTNEDLVEAQRNYAGMFLRRTAGLAAIELTVGSAVYAELEPGLFRPGRTLGSGFEYQAGEQWVWADIAGNWSAVGKRAVGASLPSDEIASDDPVAASIVRGCIDLLESGSLDLPERSIDAFRFFASEVTSSDADWYAAVDALVLGYCARKVEREEFEFNTWAAADEERYRARAVDEPFVGFAGAALVIADGMPTAFANGEDTWSETCAWLADRAIELAWARHHADLDDQTYDEPTLTRPEAQKLIAQGYGVRFAEEQLS